jgi:Tat protein secretion system quality control protein TatD with DNase activity
METAKVLAQVRNVGLRELAEQTSKNFFRLFPKVGQFATAAA